MTVISLSTGNTGLVLQYPEHVCSYQQISGPVSVWPPHWHLGRAVCGSLEWGLAPLQALPCTDNKAHWQASCSLALGGVNCQGSLFSPSHV